MDLIKVVKNSVLVIKYNEEHTLLNFFVANYMRILKYGLSFKVKFNFFQKSTKYWKLDGSFEIFTYALLYDLYMC